jgi:hypothetical protein
MYTWNMTLNQTAVSATLHCLIGCAIGEVLGMVLAAGFNWSGSVSVIISVVLAFIFGYSFSISPLLKHGLALKKALKLALAADTASIATMELSDNAFILLVPGAINAGLGTLLFWASLAISLLVAFAVALPVNRYLIARDKGHAVMHDYH